MDPWLVVTAFLLGFLLTTAPLWLVLGVVLVVKPAFRSRRRRLDESKSFRSSPASEGEPAAPFFATRQPSSTDGDRWRNPA
jgi:hypothetical protein